MGSQRTDPRPARDEDAAGLTAGGMRLVHCFARRNPGMCQQPPLEAAPLAGGEELVLKG